MKKISIFFGLALLFMTGCVLNSSTQPNAYLKTDCNSDLWICPEEKKLESGAKFVSTKVSETNVVIELLGNEKTLEEIYETKKAEVQKYDGNKIIEEAELKNGKYFVNRNNYSQNILLRTIVSKNDIFYICSGYSPKKSFESVRQEIIQLCENLKPIQ